MLLNFNTVIPYHLDFEGRTEEIHNTVNLLMMSEYKDLLQNDIQRESTKKNPIAARTKLQFVYIFISEKILLRSTHRLPQLFKCFSTHSLRFCNSTAFLVITSKNCSKITRVKSETSRKQIVYTLCKSGSLMVLRNLSPSKRDMKYSN